MFKERIARFQVTAVLPELVNQQIERIDAILEEVNLVNESGNLIARGTVKRWIYYPKSDKPPVNNLPIRRCCNRFQFSVAIGSALPENEPLLETELHQDYYTLHPAGEDHQAAILQQGFMLIIQEAVSGRQANEDCVTMPVNRVINQGTGSATLKAPLDLPSQTAPQEFVGTVSMLANQETSCQVMLTGTIKYRFTNNRLAETDLSRELFIDDLGLPRGSNHPVRLIMVISAYHFQRGRMENEWFLVLKIDYQWFMLQTEKINCLISQADPGANISVLLTVPVANYQRHIARTFFLTPPEMTPTEIQCTIMSYQDQITAKGLLLSLELRIEIYGINRNQCETYYTANYQTEELISDISEFQKDPDLDRFREGKKSLSLREARHLKLQTTLKPQAGSFTLTPEGIRLPVVFDYQVELFREEIRALTTTETGGEWIYAKQLLRDEDFCWMGEEVLRLEGDFSRVKKEVSRLSKGQTDYRHGWLEFEGEAQIMLDCLNSPHLTSRQINVAIRENFYWGGLPEGTAVQCEPLLESDAIRYSHGSLFYYYLIKLACRAWIEKPVQIRVCPVGRVPGPEEKTKTFEAESSNINTGFEIIIEEKLPLRCGVPVEFVANNLSVTAFNCYHAEGRFLISGILEWRSEYWNQKNFMQKETLQIPFWQYHNDMPFKTEGDFCPRIHRFTIEPFTGGKRTYPWSPLKPRLKQWYKLAVFLEITLKEV